MSQESTNSINNKVTRIIRKIPSSEYGAGVTCKTRSGKLYQISNNPERRKHTLWMIIDGGYEKIATGDSPFDLYQLIDWNS